MDDSLPVICPFCTFGIWNSFILQICIRIQITTKRLWQKANNEIGFCMPFGINDNFFIIWCYFLYIYGLDNCAYKLANK